MSEVPGEGLGLVEDEQMSWSLFFFFFGQYMVGHAGVLVWKADMCMRGGSR